MTRPSLSMAIAAAAAVLSAAPAESTRVRRGNLRRARGAAFEASAPPDGREDSEEYLARLIELAIGGGGRRRDAAVLRAGDGGRGPSSCGALGYHPDMNSLSGCTNDDDYDPRWLDMPNVFHDTGEGCCGYFSHLEDCTVTDVCGDDTAGAPAGGGGGSGGAGCANRRWYPHDGNMDGCANGDGYPDGWGVGPLADLMFHDTFEGCCAGHFAGLPPAGPAACRRYDNCADSGPGGAGDGGGADDAGDGTADGPCPDSRWHMSRAPGETKTCTNDGDYPPSWLDHASFFLHDTPEQCCEAFGYGDECRVRTVPCGDPAGGTPDDDDDDEAEEEDVSGVGGTPCPDPRGGTRRWHASTVPGEAAVCTNDGDFPSGWRDAPPGHFLFETHGECCARFDWSPCGRRDVCDEGLADGADGAASGGGDDGGGAGTGTGTGGTAEPCGALGYHPDMTSQSGCTNDDNVDPKWLAMPNVFHDTGEACCGYFSHLEDCTVTDVCGGIPTASTTAAPAGGGGGGSGRAGCGRWFPHDGNMDGCANGDGYPDEWNAKPLSDLMFFDTFEGCCAGHFADLPPAGPAACRRYDNCSGPGPGDDGDGGDTDGGEEEEDCVTHGWHVDRTSMDGCTNDADVDPSWLDPAIVSLMLHPTADGCCEMAFRDKPCARYEVTGCRYVDPAGGGSGGAGEGPTASPSEGPPGCMWHPSIDGQVMTCAFSDSYPQEWKAAQLAATARNFLFATHEECCLGTYRTASCGASFLCESEGPTPAPSGVPTTPPPTVEPSGSPTSVWYVHHTSGTCVPDYRVKKPWYVTETFGRQRDCCPRAFDVAACLARLPPPPPTPTSSPAPTLPALVHYLDPLTGLCGTSERGRAKSYIRTFFDDYWSCCSHLGAGGDAETEEACLRAGPTRGPSDTPTSSPAWASEVPSAEPTSTTSPTAYWSDSPSHDPSSSPSTSPPTSGPTTYMHGALAAFSAKPTHGPTLGDCSRSRWRADGDGGCTNLEDGRPVWTVLLFRTPSECCAHHLAGRECVVRDGCSRLAPSVETVPSLPGNEACPDHYWHTDYTGCTYSADFPSSYWDLPARVVFDDLGDCCKELFLKRGKDCHVENYCLPRPTSSPVTVEPTTSRSPTSMPVVSTTSSTTTAERTTLSPDAVLVTDSEGCLQAKYHITADFSMCSNSMDYPQIYLTNDRLFFFDDAASCCKSSFNYEDCPIEDICDDHGMGSTVSALASSSTTMAKNDESATNLPHLETDGCQHKWHISAIDFSKCTNDLEYLPQWLEDPELYFFDDASDCCLFAFGTSSCPKEDACSAASTNPTTVSTTATTLATTLPHFETADGCVYSKWHISLDFTKCTNDLEYQRQWLENPDLYFFNEASDCCMFAFNNPECNQEQVCLTDENLEAGAESAAAACEGLSKKQCNKAKTCEFNVASGSCDPIESADRDAVEEGEHTAASTTVPHGVCQGLSKKQCNKSETCEFNVGSGSCDPIESADFDAVEGEKPAAAATTTMPPESTAGVCEGLNKKQCNKAETCEFNDGSGSCEPIEHADVPNLSMCPSTTKKCKKSEHCYWTGTTCVPL